MALKQSNSPYGRDKGFVFSLDAAFALAIIVGILLISFSLVTQSKISSSAIFAKRIASDIVATMDYNNTLDSFNKILIESQLNSLMPQHLNMSMKINKYDAQLNLVDQIEINRDLKENFYLGKWLFVTFSGRDVKNYFVAVYKVGFR